MRKWESYRCVKRDVLKARQIGRIRRKAFPSLKAAWEFKPRNLKAITGLWRATGAWFQTPRFKGHGKAARIFSPPSHAQEKARRLLQWGAA